MNVIFSDFFHLDKYFKSVDKYIVIIGAFDGIHLGHRRLFEFVNSYKKFYNYKVLVLTFYNAFKKICLKKYSSFIFGNRERIVIFKDLDKDFRINDILFLKLNKKLIFLPSDMFLNLTKRNINLDSIVVGEDFRYGNNMEGNIETLKDFGRKNNINVISVPMMFDDDKRKISSTEIKKALTLNNLSLVKKYLGYDFFVIGKVIKGNSLARKFGYPTANLFIQTNKILPVGVFLGKINIENRFFYGIISVGKRETLKKDLKILLEVHIFDFNENIYNKIIKVFFLDYIRAQKKFDNLEKLFLQVKEDVFLAKNLLKGK